MGLMLHGFSAFRSASCLFCGLRLCFWVGGGCCVEFSGRSSLGDFGCYHSGDVVRLAARSGIREGWLGVELSKQLSVVAR